MFKKRYFIVYEVYCNGKAQVYQPDGKISCILKTNYFDYDEAARLVRNKFNIAETDKVLITQVVKL